MPTRRLFFILGLALLAAALTIWLGATLASRIPAPAEAVILPLVLALAVAARLAWGRMGQKPPRR